MNLPRLRPPNLLRPLAATALLALAGLAAPADADAQVLVYDVTFEEADRSFNFSFFERGFFVVEALGGNGSFVFTFEDEGRDFYLTAADAGELFFAVKPGKEKAVVRATSTTETARTEYLVIGDLDSSVSFNLRGQRVSARVATHMKGNVVSSDSEPDVEFTPQSEIGFAGFVEMDARLNQKRTQAAKLTDQTVAGAVQDIIDELTRMGFEDDATRDAEGGDGGGGDTGDGTDMGDGTDTGDGMDGDTGI